MRRVRANLYHWTCEHSHADIGETGHLLPVRQLRPEAAADHPFTSDLIWLTDLSVPIRLALGLGNLSGIVRCNRVEHRYRVVEPGAESIQWWPLWARANISRAEAQALNASPGARPVHWWVSTEPVEVVYDPWRKP